MKNSANYYADGSAEAVSDKRDTAFDAATRALDDAKSLVYRVNTLVERLCGPQPSEVANSQPPAPGSVLHGLRHEAESAAKALLMAHSQLNRLERELP